MINKRMKNLLAVAMLSVSFYSYGQVGIGTAQPHAGAALEVFSTSKGFQPPRLTTAQRDSIAVKVGGLTIYNTDDNCMHYWNNVEWIKDCGDATTGTPGTITVLDCTSATYTGKLMDGSNASGTFAIIPYEGGNGGTYGGQNIPSTGVTGLTATLIPGNFNTGSGNVTYTISGTPMGSGTATFAVTLDGKSCNLSFPVESKSALVTTLDCASGVTTGTLTGGIPASGVSRTVPYNGGNGASYSEQNISSTGVTGLTAHLAAGTLSSSGDLVYTITGIPSSSGTANFEVDFGGQKCSFSISLASKVATGSGSFTGKSCFDVAMVNDGGDCGTLASRLSQKADFTLPATNTQIYTFTPTGTVSNVRFVYMNTNGQVINSLSGGNSGNNITGAVNATVTYNTNLNALASGTTRSNALTARIIVIYNDKADKTGADKQLIIDVSVRDCACCGAFIAPGVWKEFMCHNLGADTSKDPLTPSKLIHGARYKWGARTGQAGVYLNQSQDEAYPTYPPGWNNGIILADKSWQDFIKTANDSCPAGYRVPNSSYWIAVVKNNPVSRIGSWVLSPTNYTTGIKFGDHLMLPAAGYRDSSSSAENRARGGYGSYWSSTETIGDVHGNKVSQGLFFDKTNVSEFALIYKINGGSIRCVAE